MKIAELIPTLTGIMIFISVILAGRKTELTMKQAWILGLISQVLLIVFGALVGHFAFFTHVLVAGAFAYNLLRRHALPVIPSGIAPAAVTALIEKYRAGDYSCAGFCPGLNTVIKDLEALLPEQVEPMTVEKIEESR